MDWIYRDKTITELSKKVYGFIYIIFYTNGQMYIGKKNVQEKATKKALANGTVREGHTRVGNNRNGKRVYFDIITQHGKWQKYEGSSEDVKELEIDRKEILYFASNKRTLTYLETKVLFEHNVLFNPMYVNKNIGGVYFDNALDGLIGEDYV